MANRPRKHHFVQAEHLRQFADKDGVLHVFSKDGGQFAGVPESIFLKKDLNSFDAPEGLDTSFEASVTNLENVCWPALKRTIESGCIHAEDLEYLATYMSLSRMRNPAVQKGIVEQHRSSALSVARLMNQSGQFKDLGPYPLDPTKSYYDLLADGTVTLEINNSVYLAAIGNMMESFAKFLLGGFSWIVVTSSKERVIISDHPLTIAHPGKDLSLYGIPAGGEGCEIAFPISKSSYLVGSWGLNLASQDSEDAVDELNKRQAIFANRQIASCHDGRRMRSLAYKYRGFGYQMRVDSIPTSNGSYEVMRSGVFETLPARVKSRAHPLTYTRPISRFLRLKPTSRS